MKPRSTPLLFAFALAVLLPPGPGAAEPWVPPGGKLEFTIARDGSEIGRQVLTFARDGTRLTVDTRVEIAVKRFFVTVHRFERTARSVWRDGLIESYTASTDNNGKKTSLSMTARGDALEIRANGQSRRVARTMKIPEFWNIDVLSEKSVVNTVTGEIDEIVASPPEKTVLEAGGKKVPALRYRVTGKTTRHLWYDEKGGLLQIARTARDGSKIVTRRRF